MKNCRPILMLFILATILCFAPPIHAQLQKQDTILAVDNYGGFSHLGKRILVYADNRCEVTYTDAVGDEKTRVGKCIFDLTAGTLTLDGGKKENERLYRVSYGGKEYWVHQDEVNRIKHPTEEWLRQISLRNQR